MDKSVDFVDYSRKTLKKPTFVPLLVQIPFCKEGCNSTELVNRDGIDME